MANAEKDIFFGPACMRKIAEALQIQDQTRLSAFQVALAKIGRKYQKAISETPMNLPNAPADIPTTRRIEWLEVNVLNPSDRLLKALDENNRHMFATWPNDQKYPPFPDRRSLRKLITQLHAFADILRKQLSYYRDEQASLSQEFRSDLIYALTEALRDHFPKIRISRGKYHASIGMVGPYPNYIRHAFTEITNISERLDTRIKGMVDLVRLEEGARLKK